MRSCTSDLRLLGLALAIALLAGCEQSELPDDASTPAPDIVRIKSAAEALQGAHISKIDPATLKGAEVKKVIGARPHCSFRYTSSGHPVVVAGLRPDGSPEVGVAKLNNHLVPLQPAGAAAAAAGFVLASEPVRISVRPLPDASASENAGAQRIEADMIFEVGQELKVGYGGFLECRTAAPRPHARALVFSLPRLLRP